MKSSHYWIYLLAFGGAVLAWRLIVLSTSSYGLVIDEAQYWIWSRSFDFGYFSKPPLVMWLISGASSICGDTESCIRLPSPILHTFTAVIVAEFVRRLWGNKSGLLAGMLYASAPGTNFSSLLITTDVPLLFFWAVAMYGWICLRQGGTRLWWLVIGFAVGLGLLAKYAMGYFILSAGIHLLVSHQQRRTLRTVYLPIGGLVAFVLFLPNILWNIDHGFVTVAHTAHIAQWGTLALNILKPLERASIFFGTQFGVAGPVAFAAFCLILWRFRLSIQDRSALMLLCFSGPVLLLVIVQAAIAKAHGNWAAPALLGVIALAAWWLHRFGSRRLILTAVIVNLLGTAGVFHYDSLLAPIFKGTVKDPHARFRGWPAFAEEIRRTAAKHSDAVIVVGQRRTFSLLTYYLRDTGLPVVKWNPFNERRDSFDVSTHLNQYTDRHYLMVVSPATVDFAKYFFCKLFSPQKIASLGGIDSKVRFSLMWVEGFRGYDQTTQKKCGDRTAPGRKG